MEELVRRLDLGTHQVAYAIAKSDGRRLGTITLCHGLASDHRTFDAVAGRIVADYDVLRLDLRGHGRSSSPPGPWTLQALADDLIGVLDAEHVDRTHLLGHSAGGVVALRAAVDHPHRIASLILVSTASVANQRAAIGYEEVAQKAEREGGAAVMRDFGMSQEGTVLPPDAEGFARAARAMATLFMHPLTPELARIEARALVVSGGRDFLGERAPQILIENIRKAKRAHFENAGHGVHLDEPEGFALAVQDFLRETG
jgi:3-oxoadipate enol-lactonase